MSYKYTPKKNPGTLCCPCNDSHTKEQLDKRWNKEKSLVMGISFQNAVWHNLAGSEPHLLPQIILEKKIPHL